MPNRSPRPCRHCGKTECQCVSPEPRPTAYQRGYDRKWAKARAIWLAQYPLCAMCLQQGWTTAAAVVDHIEPHRGNILLFWDVSNWQSLCIPCHNAKSATEKA
jgi:5-methylcytosine-specific restriction protein A